MKYLSALVAGFAMAVLCPISHAADDDAAPPAESTLAAEEEIPTSAAPEKEAIDMFEVLDYDEDLDVFYAPGTKNLYTGPVFATGDNGLRETDGYLKDGREDGWWIDYHEDGTKASEGLYRAGLEEGYWKYFHENGTLENGGNYKAGAPVGKWVAFFENGKPDFVGEYVDGLMDGDWTFYDPESGEPRVIKFERGTQLNE